MLSFFLVFAATAKEATFQSLIQTWGLSIKFSMPDGGKRERAALGEPVDNVAQRAKSMTDTKQMEL